MAPIPANAPDVLSLTVLATPLAICRLYAGAAVPSWTSQACTFVTISRTPTELSIVADEAAVPDAVKAERGYRAIRVEGPLPLDLVGVIAALASPLADAGVPIFPIATYDTDYVIVSVAMVPRAVAALTAAGHVIVDA